MDSLSVREVTIEALGHRGEGVARGPIYVPGALPGERILAEIEGQRARLIEVLEASPHRAAPLCRYFGACGGCAAQHMDAQIYAAWKRDILIKALAQARVQARVDALIDAHGEGRRRATFHARFPKEAGAADEVGFMRARAHDIVHIEDCPMLAPSMAGAIVAAREIAHCLRGLGKPLDITVTATLGGLDVNIRGAGALDAPTLQKLTAAAERIDLPRVSNHGEVAIERRASQVTFGLARVGLPPGGFLQATAEGERVLAELLQAGVSGARRVADLFCGAGAFALRLAADCAVHAVDSDGPAVAAMRRAAAETPALRPLTSEVRDLFHRPLRAEELADFDAVLFDPPRAGAAAQAHALAESNVPTVVAISCNAGSFARDARALCEGGYRIASITPIDQFRSSPHVEIIALFKRVQQRRRARRLLG